jgi:50S ribosomal subunit-associated GTPase HflX
VYIRGVHNAAAAIFFQRCIPPHSATFRYILPRSSFPFSHNMAQPHSLAPAPERAIAIGVGTKRTDREEALEHLDELAFLAETAGAEVVQKIYQALDRPERGTAVGKGKLNEIKDIIEEENIQMLIFDDDLSPAQVRNLERELSIKIMDRSGIILDIFASRARTTEAKLQVELAQLQYMLPRLTRMWTHLSKQFGGVGTKGPGETQIETDRRLVRDRITFLKERLATVAVQKAEQRKGRDSLQRFALVGYTNAGKSTLMNVLSGANVLAENKLFATLDTTVRAIEIGTSEGFASEIVSGLEDERDGETDAEFDVENNGEDNGEDDAEFDGENANALTNESSQDSPQPSAGAGYGRHKTALLSDTVGFIRKLPPHLVASFRSTLAESKPT